MHSFFFSVNSEVFNATLPPSAHIKVNTHICTLKHVLGSGRVRKKTKMSVGLMIRVWSPRTVQVLAMGGLGGC